MRRNSSRDVAACALVFVAGCAFEGVPADSETSVDAATAQCVAVPEGVVGWWDGEVVGQDIVGTGTATEIVGNPRVETGLVGSATRFGADDLFRIADAPAPALFTLEGWLNLEQGDPVAWIGIYGRFAESSACIYRNRLTFWEGDVGNGGIEGNVGLTSVVQIDTWYHFAITWDGQELRTFLDGRLESAETVIDPLALPTEVSVGGLIDGTTAKDRFAGRIDELALYSRALSEAEIAAIYSAGGLGKCK